VAPTAKEPKARASRCNRGRAKGAFSFASFSLGRTKKMMRIFWSKTRVKKSS